MTAGRGGEIASELFNAGIKSGAWPKSVVALKGTPSEMEQTAIRLVELSIDFFPKAGVVGVAYPVDAIRLTASGATWIQHKEACQ